MVEVAEDNSIAPSVRPVTVEALDSEVLDSNVIGIDVDTRWPARTARTPGAGIDDGLIPVLAN